MAVGFKLRSECVVEKTLFGVEKGGSEVYAVAADTGDRRLVLHAKNKLCELKIIDL